MAVEAGRDCLIGAEASRVAKLLVGTTTSPFADLLCSGLAAAALDLPEAVGTQDVTGSMRAGTTALMSAIDSARAGDAQVLCIATDRRAAAPASARELTTGHAAAAILVGAEPGLARYLGSASRATSLVDHFRAIDHPFDYGWEDRWVRDEGYLKIVPELIDLVLTSSNTRPSEVTHFCLPVPSAGIARTVARASKIPETAIRETLSDGCGEAGAAHPLLMLVDALEEAQPGDRILVVSFGQGGDALLFEATEALALYPRRRHGVTKWRQRRLPCSYARYAVLSGLLRPDRGIRSELDKATAMTALYRHADLAFSLTGGRCSVCGTYQIPRSNFCCNHDCGAAGTQVPYSFAHSKGRVASWSADHLTYTPDPPAFYGVIDFDEGARLMMDFTDVVRGSVEVGSEMRMVFRIKDLDPLRGFSRYFWKAAPVIVEEA
jgi:hydroxymethylglutaryl-CoA synthase